MQERGTGRLTALPRLTTVIVDYRKAAAVLRGVASLQHQYDPVRLDIVVIDNSTCPSNAARLRELACWPNVTVIVSERNLGYTAACNFAAAIGCDAEFLLLLNPDIEWRRPGALRRLVAFMTMHPEVAIAGPRQRNEDGTTPLTARRFPSLAAQLLRRTKLRTVRPFSTIVADYERPGFDYAHSQPVDWLQSSCILVRRDFWNRVGGLDEGFFLFMADCDICLRAWQEGLQVWHVAEALVTADGRRASAGGPFDLFTSRVLRRHLVDALRYHGKHAFVTPPAVAASPGSRPITPDGVPVQSAMRSRRSFAGKRPAMRPARCARGATGDSADAVGP